MLVLALVASYLLGSIPNGLWLGKALWHTDLRQYGSHNIGATNAWRTLGKGPGIAIFLLDALKGALAVGLGAWLVGTPLAMILCGILAILGHSLSVFLRFQGGKGVATGLGVILVLMPFPTLIIFCVWFVLVLITRYVSLGSIVGAVLVPIVACLFGYSWEYIAFGALAAALVVFRHRANIERLKAGTENKIQAGHR